jgi:MFS family permease
MGLRDFRLLFTGTTTSLLGDQLALIATPWLVLQLTGDPLALGFVLALEGVPRAVFMLIGGAVTDRLSPRLIMLVSDFVRLVLTALMAFAILTGIIETWMLYAFGLGFGLVAGFAVPAENSIVPMIVGKDELQAGNSIMMGIGQLVGFVGPTLAGIVIAGYAQSNTGVGLAFAIDAMSFAVSAVCLWMIVTGKPAEDEPKENLLASIRNGMRFLWNDWILRLMILSLTAINFLLMGPLLVGIPVLANQRLPEGAVAYGLLMSAFAGGNLVGFLLAGSLPRPSGNFMRWFMVGFLVAFGVIVGVLGFIHSTWLDFALLLLIGLGNGYVAINLFTWMQNRTPKDMLGRIMSIMMFSNTGLVPISQSIACAAGKWDLNMMFLCAGTLMVIATVIIAMQPAMKDFAASLVADKTDA